MTPLYLGPRERRLFGAYQEGTRESGTTSAVLLCNPFGQEAVRVHRLYRVLADRLSKAGVHVLRFDPFGTGDSAGDDDDVTFEGWCSDVRMAHEELLQRSRATSVAWMGVRLGGTMALLAGTERVRPRRVLLWDPIVDGAAYVRQLRFRHLQELQERLPSPDASGLDSGDGRNPEIHEALGFTLSPTLQRDLRALHPDRIKLPNGINVHLMGDPDDTVLTTFVQSRTAQDALVDFVPIANQFDWVSSEAANTALVPPFALQHVTALLTQ